MDVGLFWNLLAQRLVDDWSTTVRPENDVLFAACGTVDTVLSLPFDSVTRRIAGGSQHPSRNHPLIVLLPETHTFFNMRNLCHQSREVTGNEPQSDRPRLTEQIRRIC